MPPLSRTDPSSHSRFVRTRWWALLILTLPVVLMSVDLTVLSMAVPMLSEALKPTGNELLWIIDIYGIFLAGLLILMGSLGDRIGRRSLLLAGGAAFGLASVLAAFAWSPTALITARALLGIGGATLMPATLALIRSIFPDALERRRALSIWAAAFAGGAGLGPVLGGFLLEHFWWGSVFLINVPIMILLLVLGPFLLPNAKDPHPGPFAPLSALQLIVGILLAIYGLKEIGKHGWSFTTVILIVLGLALLTAFTARQARLDQPLVDVSLFRSLPFSLAVLANVAGVFALTGILYFLPQYAQLVLNKAPMAAGLWALPIAAAAILGAVCAPSLSKKFPVGWVIGGGLVIASIGYFTLTHLGVDEALALAFFGGGLVGLGVGLADTLANDVIIATAPPQRAGAAAGISETAYELGGVLGTAILGSIGLNTYRHKLENAMPTIFPDELVRHATETLGDATHIAQQLPEPAMQQFLDHAYRAFVDGMTKSFFVGMIVVAIAGIGAIVTLRSRVSQQHE